MPKCDVVLQPGDEVPADFAALIREKLGRAQLDRLQQHGGLIRLSVAAPYVGRAKDAPRVLVDKGFLTELHAIRRNGQELDAKIRNLRMKELKTICRELSIPVRSKATAHEVRAQIVDFIRSEDKWQAIAQS